jgi:hypothetical protein
MKPKDDLRDDTGAIFSGAEADDEPGDLTDPEVALAAFKAVYFDNPLVQELSQL